MVFYRLLHSYQWSFKKRRYKSSGFQVYGDGVSVICKPCTIQRSATAGETVIDRIRKFYPPKPSNVLTVVWELDRSCFSKERDVEFKHSVSTRGDVCHHDIVGLTDEEAGDYIRDAFEKDSVKQVLLRDNGGVDFVPTNLAELEILLGNPENPRGELNRPGDLGQL